LNFNLQNEETKFNMKYYGNKENFESNPWLFQKYFVSLWQLCVKAIGLLIWQ